MEGDQTLQNVTKEVLLLVAFKLNIIKELPSINVPSVSSELIENLRMIVWAERYVAIEDSKEFMWNHFKKMTSSPKMYGSYVIYACHLVKKCFTDSYEAFVRTLTLVVQMALYSMPKRLTELLGWSFAIFTNFFEKELESDFYDRGGWKGLNEYLLRKNSLTMYATVDLLEMQGKRPDEMAAILGIETTLLEKYLSQDVTESEIKGHGPTLCIWEMIETTGFNAGSEFSSQLMESRSMKEKEVNQNPATSRDSLNGAFIISVIENQDSQNTLQQTEEVQTVIKNSATSRIAYGQAKESLRDLQIDCQRIEQLLDIAFGDIPDDF